MMCQRDGRYLQAVFHWHQNVYNTRKMLILTLSEVRFKETLASGYRSLTGIERDWADEGR
jgi:hypothetical protein